MGGICRIRYFMLTLISRILDVRCVKIREEDFQVGYSFSEAILIEESINDNSSTVIAVPMTPITNRTDHSVVYS